MSGAPEHQRWPPPAVVIGLAAAALLATCSPRSTAEGAAAPPPAARGTAALRPADGSPPAAPAPAASPPTPATAPRRVVFLTTDREVSVEVELAATPSDRARGLMYREALEPGKGMAFVFGRREVHSFWMKNTLIPLDMLFIDGHPLDGDLRVVGVVERAEPQTLTPRKVDAPSVLVVEVPGGWASQHGVAAGTLVRVEGVDLPELPR